MLFFPKNLPNNERVTFDARYYPAERVSGDFYNIFRLDENRIGLYIGRCFRARCPRRAMLTVFLNQSIEATKELEGGGRKILKPSRVLGEPL